MATLQAAANIEYRMKTENKDLKAEAKKRKDEEFVMTECNHGNAISFEKRSTQPYFKKANQMDVPAGSFLIELKINKISVNLLGKSDRIINLIRGLFVIISKVL